MTFGHPLLHTVFEGHNSSLRHGPIKYDLCLETFWLSEGRLHHRVPVGDHSIASSIILSDYEIQDLQYEKDVSSRHLKGAWWQALLQGVEVIPSFKQSNTIRMVDLFAGAGGLALGVQQLVSEAGLSLVSEVAVDTDVDALEVYATNHNARLRSEKSVGALIDFRMKGRGDRATFTYAPEIINSDIAEAAHGVDLVMAGPPCQGHSNLNNQTRRNDPRSQLYLTIPAFAVACSAKAVVIENVPAVVHDRSHVVQATQSLLESSGYFVDTGCLSADALGWPQTRTRHFLIAQQDSPPIPIDKVSAVLSEDRARSVLWAIKSGRTDISCDLLDQPSQLNADNTRRVKWLFENNAYDLPLSERPVCHQDGTSYGSVYGRMYPDRPAGTITTGFMTPGRGRYVHPTEPRTLTPQEAACLQGFPVTYRFVVDPGKPPARSQLAKWIGDAVPAPLGYAAALSAIGRDLAYPAPPTALSPRNSDLPETDRNMT